MTSVNYKNPLTFDDVKSHDHWKIEVKMWQLATDLDKEEGRALVLALSLHEKS